MTSDAEICLLRQALMTVNSPLALLLLHPVSLHAKLSFPFISEYFLILLVSSFS